MPRGFGTGHRGRRARVITSSNCGLKTSGTFVHGASKFQGPFEWLVLLLQHEQNGSRGVGSGRVDSESRRVSLVRARAQ